MGIERHPGYLHARQRAALLVISRHVHGKLNIDTIPANSFGGVARQFHKDSRLVFIKGNGKVNCRGPN